MANDPNYLKKDADGKIPIPQFKRRSDSNFTDHRGEYAPFYQMVDEVGNIVGGNKPINMQLSGSKVEEQKTQTNAVSGVLTFAENIGMIGIYNTSGTSGVFNVNGIDITVPANTPFEANVGGTPRKTVNVTGATSYIVTRYK